MSECGLNSGQKNGLFKFPPSISETKVYIFIMLIVYTKSFTVFINSNVLWTWSKNKIFLREIGNHNHLVQY